MGFEESHCRCAAATHNYFPPHGLNQHGSRYRIERVSQPEPVDQRERPLTQQRQQVLIFLVMLVILDMRRSPAMGARRAWASPPIRTGAASRRRTPRTSGERRRPLHCSTWRIRQAAPAPAKRCRPMKQSCGTPKGCTVSSILGSAFCWCSDVSPTSRRSTRQWRWRQPRMRQRIGVRGLGIGLPEWRDVGNIDIRYRPPAAYSGRRPTTSARHVAVIAALPMDRGRPLRSAICSAARRQPHPLPLQVPQRAHRQRRSRRLVAVLAADQTIPTTCAAGIERHVALDERAARARSQTWRIAKGAAAPRRARRRSRRSTPWRGAARYRKP
jgi:hypothetical protein